MNSLVAFAAGVTVSLVTSILSSWVFWRWLVRVKPRIEISRQACYCWRHDRKADKYRKAIELRIMNCGRRPVTDMRFSAEVMDRVEHDDRPIASVYGQGLEIKVDPPQITAVSAMQDHWKPWDFPNPILVYLHPGEEIWNILSSAPDACDRRLVFEVSAVDSLSGVKVVQRATYAVNEIVEEGQFASGMALYVIPPDTTGP